jgi:3-oxocholest-4-en-26-oate---CoA ligase
MEWHTAEALEAISDAIPDEIAIVNGDVRRSWRDYEQRAASLAGALAAAGLKPDSKVGIYGYNSNEFLEALFAAFKIRGAAVNVNYRYTEDELVYLLDDADAEALFFDAAFAQVVEGIRRRLPKLRVFIEIDDGSGKHLEGAIPFEAAIACHKPLPRADYSPDDIYLLYTGGTTGMPKGVMYRHGDLSQILLMGYDQFGQKRPANIAELAAAAARNRASGMALTNLPACPLMHGVGLWIGVFFAHMMGGQSVTFRNNHFDAAKFWEIIERERVNVVAIVGDAFAKPMLNALQAAGERRYDLSSLKMIFSSGVMFSRQVKAGLLEFGDFRLVDSMGASEGGIATSIVSRANEPAETGTFVKMPTTRVFDEQFREIPPGSDKIGLVANGGRVPIGYYKDPAKSAATFRVIDGHRYSIPGDFAKVAADGSLILLGRGSACVNTGGEKVFPEEVEEALKTHPDVEDSLVVGLPDDRFGQRVVAVVAPCAGAHLDIAELMAFARKKIAGYKTPRQVVLVEEVKRAPNGKADYKWAKEVALMRTTALPG